MKEKKHPTVYSTADIAVTVVKDNSRLILLGKKEGESKFVFPGGFCDPLRDNDYLDTGIRELFEETKIHTLRKDMNCIYAGKVNDPRYIDSEDCIFTNFFYLPYVNKKSLEIVEGSDDLPYLEWLELEGFKSKWVRGKHIVKHHQVLMEKLIKYVYKT